MTRLIDSGLNTSQLNINMDSGNIKISIGFNNNAGSLEPISLMADLILLPDANMIILAIEYY